MNIKNRVELSLLFEKYHNFLSQTQKQVLQLYLFEDLSLSEISDITATSRQAINDAIKKAERKLESIDKKLNI